MPLLYHIERMPNNAAKYDLNNDTWINTARDVFQICSIQFLGFFVVVVGVVPFNIYLDTCVVIARFKTLTPDYLIYILRRSFYIKLLVIKNNSATEVMVVVAVVLLCPTIPPFLVEKIKN